MTGDIETDLSREMARVRNIVWEPPRTAADLEAHARIRLTMYAAHAAIENEDESTMQCALDSLRQYRG